MDSSKDKAREDDDETEDGDEEKGWWKVKKKQVKIQGGSNMTGTICV